MAGYKIPKQFQDEDKWFRFFTKTQLVVIGLPAILSIVILFKIRYMSGIVIFITSAILITILVICILFSSFKMPKDKYLLGGGTSLKTLGLRLIRRRMQTNKVLWVKNYGDHFDGKKKREFKNPLSGLMKFDD